MSEQNFSLYSPQSSSAMSPSDGIPDTFPFSQGMPLFPLYGFDSMEDEARDDSYVKHLFAEDVKYIQQEIEEECDKLEYEGSCMYHAYPDKNRLQMITSVIYDRVKDRDFHPEPLEINSLSQAETCFGRNCPPPPPCRGRHCPPPCFGRNCPPPRRDFRDNGKPDWLKHLIDTLLFEEINHRRRRFRSRRPWR